MKVFGITNTVCDKEATWEALNQVRGKKHLVKMTGAADEASGVAETSRCPLTAT